MALERQQDDENNPWWGEHIHRYNEALKLFNNNNLTVLDLACGNGFGSNFNNVIGGDISDEVVEDCRKKYRKENLLFERLDGTKIPYEQNTFDVVVSFETIEHTRDYDKMIGEFKRIVKKEGGIVIISTPNITVNSPGGNIVNQYHTQEWTYEELSDILKSHFSEVQIKGQQYSRYKNKNKFNFLFSSIVERILYWRGIRKLPLKWQDAIIYAIIGKTMYPLASDYELVSNRNEIEKCKTFFAICKP